ncbi:putative OPA3-like protein CG13603 [Amyelois transitella]|uniref:putative OPA3-like protein CG13603 n=1 Tax=Amyelois transitella TaxID=680683 RepID=UPI00067BAC63|nr:putative OPA3-like protein CG13603 [Amyelois transitella]
MVVGAFPIAKLSVLLIKQISKPIANVCKERAKNSPFFRTYVCMPPAQFYNWCEVKAKMWILNLGKPVNIPVLSQEMAIELGANLLGETVIFVIGAGLLIVEYNRQSKKETAKELKRENEMKHITSTITDLYFTVQQQQTQLREMERAIHSLSGSKKPILPPLPAGPSQPPPQSPATPNLQNMNIAPVASHDNSQFTHTPYPNRGIILQSLNYIQMDVLSSLFPSNNVNKERAPEEKAVVHHRRDKAVLSEALYDIENNFRSLF